jgi:hypothetical protein
MDFNIHDFPEDLHRKVKARASALGQTIKEFSTGVFEAALGTEGALVTCPLCGLTGPLVRSGENARCWHCGSGFVLPEG